MKHTSRKIVCLGVALSMLAQPVQAAFINFSPVPLYLGANIPPIVMLNISRDHELHYRAYNDYQDLDGDGLLDTKYKNDITYYGYFDSFKCYNYVASDAYYASPHFVPVATTADKYCTGQWSGNFLNWATMTRMDLVRKLLYGGKRIVDTVGTTDANNVTVLERNLVTADGHAWAKYYDGLDKTNAPDIAKLTPFSDILTTPPTTSSSSSVTIASGTSVGMFTIAAWSGTGVVAHQIGDQVKVQDTANPANFMLGVVRDTNYSATTFNLVVDASGVGGAGTISNWRVTNLTQTGLTLCNVTDGDLASGAVGSSLGE